MKTQKIILWGLIDAVGVAIYVALVAFFLSNAEKIFGPDEPKSFLIPSAMLMLLVISAAITGSLVFGRPVYLIYTGQKNAGFKMFFYTLGFLGLITVMVFLGLVWIK